MTIYLDWAATAPIDPAAADAMAVEARAWANPSSVHAAGRRAQTMLDECRRRIAAAFDVPPSRVVFTGGGTEALGLALAQGVGPRFVSAVEHDAVRAQAGVSLRPGARGGAAVIPVDDDGVVNLEVLEEMIAHADAPRVAVMHANNETGVIQPVAEVARLVAARGGTLLVDAVQSAGKLPLPEADYVAVSAHKLGGPPGVGALIVREEVTAVQRGGGQERGQRAGTENLPGIAGFAAAAAARAADHGWHHRAHGLRDRLEAGLQGATIHGARAPRLGTIVCAGLPGVAAMTQLMHLDLAGVAVSAGAACSSGKVRTSHVLAAMGLSDAAAGEAIRFSLGWTTTAADIDAATAAWRAMAARLARAAA
ncbi:MAG: aminotransferase class V-fold PLP-dependent enzyme [Sphingomonadaceae bacterium]|nr:aminotransferase class V-fold PLP-dependent enzyme [Sphingomonadaceae bacterium]